VIFAFAAWQVSNFAPAQKSRTLLIFAAVPLEGSSSQSTPSAFATTPTEPRRRRTAPASTAEAHLRCGPAYRFSMCQTNHRPRTATHTSVVMLRRASIQGLHAFASQCRDQSRYSIAPVCRSTLSLCTSELSTVTISAVTVPVSLLMSPILSRLLLSRLSCAVR
jgi:hypothetical protein